MKSKKKIVIIAIVIFMIILTIVGYLITASNMKKNFRRYDYPVEGETARWFYDHYENDYPRESADFKSDENNLKGFIYGMDNDKGLIVFAHGIGRGHERYLV